MVGEWWCRFGAPDGHHLQHFRSTQHKRSTTTCNGVKGLDQGTRWGLREMRTAQRRREMLASHPRMSQINLCTLSYHAIKSTNPSTRLPNPKSQIPPHPHPHPPNLPPHPIPSHPIPPTPPHPKPLKNSPDSNRTKRTLHHSLYIKSKGHMHGDGDYNE